MIRITEPYCPTHHFFFPFFFFTPPPVDADCVLGKLEPCTEGETAAGVAGAAGLLDGRRVFVIF
jgi:hypothetical protein